MLYFRYFGDPHKCWNLIPGKVLSPRFKMVYICKTVLSGWLVKNAAYFTNKTDGRGCLFPWPKILLVIDIYNNKLTTLFIQQERDLASLFKKSRIKEHTSRDLVPERLHTWKRWNDRSQKAANSDMVGVMTRGYIPNATRRTWLRRGLIKAS